MTSSVRSLLALLLVLGLAVSAGSASAELTPWDQAKVSILAKDLVTAAQALQDTFQSQPPPMTGSGQSRDYYRLKQIVRHLRQEATQLSGDLEKGAGMEETLASYEDLMMSVRDAREVGARIFATQGIKDKAATARAILNQLSPYYDPDAVPLTPVQR